MSVFLTTIHEFLKNGKDWLAIFMVFIVGVYWGVFKIDELSMYYMEYAQGFAGTNDAVVSQAHLAIMVLTRSYVTFMILCFLVIASGLLFGVMTIAMMAIQGMYLGFKIHSLELGISDLSNKYIWMVGLTELVQIIFLLSAGALGLRFGRIMALTIYETLRGRAYPFRQEFTGWWDQTLRYSILAMFVLGINALLQVGIVFLV